MNSISDLYNRMLLAFEVEGLDIPATYVKIYSEGQEAHPFAAQYGETGETVMSCQAARHAAQGNPVYLTLENIGCVAAAISLGLIDPEYDQPLPGRRVYTCLMRDQSQAPEAFVPPSPLQFSQGVVYACRDAGRPEFGLFGEDDSGRFKDVATALKAMAGMTRIEPANTRGVLFYSNNFEDPDLVPDLVLLDVRPVELTRLVQGYQYLTGERVEASMGAVRAVNSDLIARPYVTGKINVTAYCLGARLVAGFSAGRLGMGFPYKEFVATVEGMEQSRTGYPFGRYPGAAPHNTGQNR